jgi:hypothetical protein
MFLPRLPTRHKLKIFQNLQSLYLFTLKRREGIMSISSQFFSELTIFIYISIFTFSFTIFICVYLVLFTFTVFMYIYKTLSRILLLHFHKQTTPKKGRDIIPDIFNKVLTRAFWRQNYFTFNKPAPFGAKILRSTSLEVLHPFHTLDPVLGSDQPNFLCI